MSVLLLLNLLPYPACFDHTKGVTPVTQHVTHGCQGHSLRIGWIKQRRDVILPDSGGSEKQVFIRKRNLALDKLQNDLQWSKNWNHVWLTKGRTAKSSKGFTDIKHPKSRIRFLRDSEGSGGEEVSILISNPAQYRMMSNFLWNFHPHDGAETSYTTAQTLESANKCYQWFIEALEAANSAKTAKSLFLKPYTHPINHLESCDIQIRRCNPWERENMHCCLSHQNLKRCVTLNDPTAASSPLIPSGDAATLPMLPNDTSADGSTKEVNGIDNRDAERVPLNVWWILGWLAIFPLVLPLLFIVVSLISFYAWFSTRDVSVFSTRV